MKNISPILVAVLMALASMPSLAQDILQSRGSDQRLNYRSLERFGPWDDRNYGLAVEDLDVLAPNEDDLYPGIPAFFRIELRKEWPHIPKTGPAQYPRAALQAFRIRHGGLMRNGVIARRANSAAARIPVTVDGELQLNDVLEADEITVEINPVFPLRVIAGSNTLGGGQKMYYSSDGGTSWFIGDDGDTNGVLNGTCCDPTVGWSSDGTIAYAAALSSQPLLGVNFYRSTDFGASWTLSDAIAAAGMDKEFLHVDISPTSPFKDNVYVTYHSGTTMQFARSTDMGLNFTVDSFGGAPSGIGSDITTDSAGNVYYIYASFGDITLIKSTNGGTSFGAPITVSPTNASFDYPIPSMETRRAWTYAATDADRSGGPFDGNIYAAWTDTSTADNNINPDANHTRIVVARSADGGVTWQTSIPHPTSDINTVDRYNQWLTVDERGIVHVVYYNTMNSVGRSGVDLYYANSDDGGTTWNAEERVSTVTSVNVTNGQEWGDYNGISVINGQIVTAWTDNRLAPTSAPDVFASRLTLELLPASEVWVDFGFSGTETGSQSNPFNTLSEAVFAADDGGAIHIKGDTGAPATPETLTLAKAMTVEAVGGAVQIGTPAQLEGVHVSADVPVAIPNDATVTSTLTISGSLTITDLNVTLNISHSRDADLLIELISPSSTVVTLVDERGGSGDDFDGTLLDDEAGAPIASGTPPFAGSYRPESSLSNFDNEDAAGIWTLRITDSLFIFSGELTGWSIELND